MGAKTGDRVVAYSDNFNVCYSGRVSEIRGGAGYDDAEYFVKFDNGMKMWKSAGQVYKFAPLGEEMAIVRFQPGEIGLSLKGSTCMVDDIIARGQAEQAG